MLEKRAHDEVDLQRILDGKLVRVPIQTAGAKCSLQRSDSPELSRLRMSNLAIKDAEYENRANKTKELESESTWYEKPTTSMQALHDSWVATVVVLKESTWYEKPTKSLWFPKGSASLHGILRGCVPPRPIPVHVEYVTPRFLRLHHPDGLLRANKRAHQVRRHHL